MNTHFTKENAQMMKKHRKNVQCYQPPGKRKLKPQGNITTYLSDWLKKKIIISPPNAEKDAEKLGLLYFAGQNVEMVQEL